MFGFQTCWMLSVLIFCEGVNILGVRIASNAKLNELMNGWMDG